MRFKEVATLKTLAGNKDGVRLRFVRVRKTHEHAKILYELLGRRTHPISHQTLPPWKEHLDFVLHHPYRAWYVIESGNRYIGCFYILKSNCIGIWVSEQEEICVPLAIEFILNKYKPLPAIKSVRAAEFDINVAPENKRLIAALVAMGARMAQMTFVVNSN